MDKNHVSTDERRKLVAVPITLNGKPSKIVGILSDYALVADRETGLGCQWAWPAVRRVIAKGGAFRS